MEEVYSIVDDYGRKFMLSDFTFPWHFVFGTIGVLYFYGLYSIDSLNAHAFFPGSITFRRVVQTKLKPDFYGPFISKLKEWANDQMNKTKEKRSKHWWIEELPAGLQKASHECSWNESIKNMFATLFQPDMYTVEEIPSMNELYVAGEDNPMQTYSDRVFFLSHIDGPFGLIPFVSIYRCLIGCNDQDKITTYFPLHNTHAKIQEGNVLAFDFNREIHYIHQSKTKPKPKPQSLVDEKRVVLKVHYCIYPKPLKWLGKMVISLNTFYNSYFRKLFLSTINPKSALDYFYSCGVVYSSFAFVCADFIVGHKNLLYLAFVYSLHQDVQYLFLLYPCIHKMIQLYHIESTQIEGVTFIRDILLFYILNIIHGYNASLQFAQYDDSYYYY